MSERVDILFVDHAAEPGGAQFALVQVMEAAAVWRCAAYLPAAARWADSLGPGLDRSLPMPAAGESADARRTSGLVGAVRRAGVDTARSVLHAHRVLRRLRPRLVYLNTPKALLTVGLAARLTRTPYAFHAHDALSPEWIPSPLIRRLVLGLVAGAQLVVVNSAYAAQFLPRHTLVWPNPVDDEFLEPVSPAPADPFTVTLVARLDPWKGQDLLLRAVHRAVGDRPHHVVLVGGALFGREDYAAEVQALADELGLHVTMTGHVGDVRDRIDASTVLVSATRGAEPLGQGIMQAQARARCVVVPDVGGPLELVEDGVSGYVYRAEDVDSLAGVLADLAAHPEKVRAVEGPARERAESYRKGPSLAAVTAALRTVLG